MKLTVASSPHIRGNFRTNRIMADVMLALTQNGVPVSGAVAGATIATVDTQMVNLSIAALVRVMCYDTANLSVLVDGTAAPTVENMALRVVKVV